MSAPGDYDVVFYVPWISELFVPGVESAPGGAETQIALVAEGLASRGMRVAIVAFEHPHLPERAGSIEILQRPRSRTKLRLVGKFAETAAVWRVLGSLDARVFVQRAAGFETGLVALVARARRRRFVYSSANVVDFEFDRVERRRRNRALFRLGVRLASEIVVQTPEQERLCRESFERAATMIKSIAEPAPGRSGKPRWFLWIGRVVDYKRPLEFVELARALPEAEFQMVAVPTGDYDRDIAARVEAAGRELDNLTVLPQQPRRAVLELMESAVAIVNTAEYEGMPNIYLEGWSRGVPALSLHHDPDGVIVREGLGGFAGGSSERLVNIADEQWRTRDDQAEVAARCRSYIEAEHAPDAVLDRWQAVIGGPAPSAPSPEPTLALRGGR